jgi:hypothetical protein
MQGMRFIPVQSFFKLRMFPHHFQVNNPTFRAIWPLERSPDFRQLRFGTYPKSRKLSDIAVNPRCSILFFDNVKAFATLLGTASHSFAA